MSDWWGAYECLCCSGDSGKATSFDVRFDEREAINTVLCPLCQKPCELRAQWEADEGGYGSRADRDAEKEMMIRAKAKTERIEEAWCALFFCDNDSALALASHLLGLEGYDLYRLRDAIHGVKSDNYSNIEDFKPVEKNSD